MSASTVFELRLLKGAVIGERRLVAGTQFEAEAARAYELIRAGVARLSNPDDLPVLAEIVGPGNSLRGRAWAR